MAAVGFAAVLQVQKLLVIMVHFSIGVMCPALQTAVLDLRTAAGFVSNARTFNNITSQFTVALQNVKLLTALMHFFNNFILCV